MNGREVSVVERLVTAGLVPETKVIRRVRTPAGVRRFDQPIGSIIVRDIPLENPLRSLTRALDGDSTISFAAADEDKPTGRLKKYVGDNGQPGWDLYMDGPEKFDRWVGKTPDGWEVRDSKDRILSGKHRTKKEATDAMHAAHSLNVKDSDLPQFPRERTTGKFKDKRPTQETIAKSKLRPVRTERELAEHARANNYSIPPDAVNVYISDDPDNPETAVYAWFWQTAPSPGRPNGKAQSRQTRHAATSASDQKFTRIERFKEDVKKVDKVLTQANVNKDDDLAVIALMRHFGARVGSDTGASDDARGVVLLKRKDVKFTKSGKSVSMQYQGKKNALQTYETDNPLIVKMLQSRLKKMGSDPDARFFPTTNSDKTTARVEQIAGAKYKNHDWRTLMATENAEKLMRTSKYKSLPKTQAELKQRQKEIDAIVGEMLNDKPGVAIKSYIDPRIWSKWVSAVKKSEGK